MADSLQEPAQPNLADRGAATREQSAQTYRDAQQESLLRLALEATSDGIWSWHIPTGEAHFSPRYFTMLGYDPDELPASYETWASLLHPDDLENTQTIIREHLASKKDGYEVEFRLRMKSGQWLWILGRGQVVERDAAGRPLRMVGSHVNIDRRKRAEEKLNHYRRHLERMVKERTRELERTTSLLEATFDAIPDVLGVQDNRHRMIRYNAAGYRLLNKTPAEVVGRRCFELIGRDRECETCATSECYRTHRPASVVRYEKALSAWLDVRAYPILDKKGQLVNVIEHLRDITPSKQAEAENRRLNEQLQQAQKMEALGTLAGGIAHDFNNLLMGIQGRISLMTVDRDPSHSSLEHLEAIEDYIQSATHLTKQLLGFARVGKYEVRPIDMNALVSGSAAMFGRTHKEIEIHTQLIGDPLIVEADRRQIEQVLLNLYINAWQAMPDGGRIVLHSECVLLDAETCRSHQVRPGRFAKISIRDTGVGMDDAIRKKIFDPFFTTKAKGSGTGLGLASAYGIIRNHAGFIAVHSDVGRGTTFTLYLPLSEKALSHQVGTPKELHRGSETILLIDDEKMIIDIGKALLEKLGYKVLVASGGLPAIDMMGKIGDRIDLVILDMVMPGLDGGKTFDRIRKLRPHVPVILSSGYTMNPHVSAIMQKGCDGFIQKPFNLSELSAMVRKILDRQVDSPSA